MADSPYEPVRQPRRLWLQRLRPIAPSHLPGSLPLRPCAVCDVLLASGASDRCADRNLTLADAARVAERRADAAPRPG